ncbi:MAG: mandelate racemase/muconate lactonizing enzyme family protein [Planctomycetaceae bacterium]|nr:mandelate racemase/muconate lactonizing enzyme family protein [Planctomycetaceae bacterium]
MSISRRQFLRDSGQAITVLALTGYSHAALRAEGSAVDARHYEVTGVERTTARLEYRPVPRRNMDREIPHWRYVEICDVTLKCGVTGAGETLLYYTWGATDDEDVQRVIGKNAVEMMWDDSLGAGLQMALFDAVAKAADVPAYALMGTKVHNTTALSWWNIDTSAEDMAAECQEAYRLGYRSYKTKGRPWYDIWKQMDTTVPHVPPEFKIDMDFNDTLLTAEQGLPILERLDKYPQIDIYESPIPQGDVEGNRRIADATKTKIAMHYGTPAPAVVVQSGCCDGFVVSRGATARMATARFCEEVGLPFWLQMVGAGLTAAFSLQNAGVMKQAVWPAVNCHQLYENDLLITPITLDEGYAAVPDRPGIGYDIDRDALQKYKVPKPPARPEPERLIETTWSDGRRMYTANDGKVNFMLTAGQQGKYPFYVDGADTRLVPNDGSTRWRALYTKAREQGPIDG